MHRPNYFQKDVVKLATVAEAMQRYRMGRNALVELAKREDAFLKFGRSARIDVVKLDNALGNYAEG